MLDRCLAVVRLPGGRKLYVFLQLAHVPTYWRDLATRDESGRAWVVIV